MTQHKRIDEARPVGHILEIWRYPVSSVGGERLSAATLDATGIVGDRQYALIDRATGLPAAPEKDLRWRKALHLQARSVAGHFPEISFPDGSSCLLDDPALNDMLSDYFGFAAAVAANPRTANPRTSCQPDFPLTHYRHPHFSVHLLTTTTLRHLARLDRTAMVDVRRFRPTVLIETGEGDGFIERSWVGQRLRLGAANLTAQEETKRCGMIFISQPGLEDDPKILRNVLRHNKRRLGIYCSVADAAAIHVGDRALMSDVIASNAATSGLNIGLA